MTNYVTEAFVQQFDTTIRLLAQQKESRLEAATTDRGSITGESFTANFMSDLEETPENVIRHGDTEWANAQHVTRVALMKDFYQALPVDRNDEPKVLADPVGPYTQSLLAAWNRRKDSIIIEALRADARARDGSLVSLPAEQKIAAGAAGFTLEKLIHTRALFRKNECDEHTGEHLFMAYDPGMMEDILENTTLTSIDYLTVQMLQEGDVAQSWMGFTWIPYNRLPSSGGVTYVVAWAKSALHKGTGFVEGRSETRADKKDTLQLSQAGSFGAVRVHERGVVEIAFV